MRLQIQIFKITPVVEPNVNYLILFQVLITLIGVLLANSASEPILPTDWSNETHRQSNNKSLNKNSQDW